MCVNKQNYVLNNTWLFFPRHCQEEQQGIGAIVIITSMVLSPDGKGPFTNYVYKTRGVGGQKKSNLVNVVRERLLLR